MRSNQTIKFFIALVGKIPLLTEKEKRILVKRLEEMPLYKIGKNLLVTGERVRQIEKQALHKFSGRSYQQVLFE